jgi:protein O-GlcNAc transferase
MLFRLLRQLLRGRSSGEACPVQGAVNKPENGWIEEALRLRREHRYEELAALCRSVLAKKPANADALNLLAAALFALAQPGEGLACLRRVTEATPESAEASAHLAAALAATGNPDEAIDCYRRAIKLQPDFADAWHALAQLLHVLGRDDEAETCCRSGLRADKRHAALYRTLADVLFEQGRVDTAADELRAALAINADAPAVHSALCFTLNFSDSEDPLAIWHEHREWGKRHGRPLAHEAPPHDNDPDPGRRLRIGYVSPYFRKHAVTFFLESTLEHHDRDRFEIMLYADVAQPDDYSRRLQEYGAIWRDTVGKSDAELAAMVRRDAVDILVDLSGQTRGNRLLAFARRPAPVQVTWNGYPNTTGMTSMDYCITDAFCDPPGATEHLSAEKLVRLPTIHMAWRPPAGAPAVGPLPALESGHVTFGSFNACYKITPRLVAMWSKILAQLPQSRLMLIAVNGAVAKKRILDLFAANGIDSQRIEIRPRLSHEQFLAVHQEADIALDSFPFHGVTTTCFSLWMGLPVVTLAGVNRVSRNGVSMLSNAGLPQLVAQDDEEYVAIATRLAVALPALAEMRAGLRERMQRAPNTDGIACARAVDNAFREMWATWCKKKR